MRPSRWIEDVDIRLGWWLSIGATSGGAITVVAAWDRPHRFAMLGMLALLLALAFAVVRSRTWIVRSERRAEVVFTLWSLATLVTITLMAALDARLSSPSRAFLFVPVAYATLAYPFRGAAIVAGSSILCFLGLAIAQGNNVSDTMAIVLALGCVGTLGVRQAWQARQRRDELIAQRDELRETEQRFRAGFEHAPIGAAMMTTDGHYLWVNGALCRLLGRSRRDLQGHHWLEFTHPDDHAVDQETVRGLLDGDLDHAQHEKRYVHADGHLVHALVGDSPIRDADGTIRFLYVQVVDVTALRDATTRAQRRTDQQSSVAVIGQGALDGRPVLELLDDIVETMKQSLGVPFAEATELGEDGELVGRAARGWQPGFATTADPKISLSGYTISIGEPVHVTSVEEETRFDPIILRRFGLGSAISVPVPDPDGGFWGVLIASSTMPGRFEDDDMSFLVALSWVLAGALRRASGEERLRHLSLHDTLTGLPNRTLLLDRLEHALARKQRTGETVALMFLDVDHFKTVNDAYGHAVGDELLRTLTPRLLEVIRVGDTLARFGGDEFIALCEGLGGAAEAQALAERLLATFETPFVLGTAQDEQTEHYVSASIGIALAGPEHLDDPEDLIRNADIAMYSAKEARGRFEFFDQVSRTRVVHRVRTTTELRRALDENELYVAYQPIVSLADGSVRRMEALLRWRHPERGLVSPADFIPIAEESGLILPIGEWVLDEVCRQLAAWDRHHDPRLHGLRAAVNLSARQLVEPGLPALVAETIEQHGIEPARIVCEMTETALIDDPMRATMTVTGLVDAGVLVSLDDFCTGYSALVHLKRFPLSAIKFDRTFVAEVATSTVDMAVIRGLTEMAATLRLSTIAEGVENRDQLTRLHELKCELAQGFLFSPGLAAADFETLLHSLPDGRFDLAAVGRDEAAA